MPKAVRLTDIATLMEVSTVTVSKALSGKEGVSDEIRAKIRECAAEMGYKGVGTKKKILKGGTGNVGVLIPKRFLDRANSFYWEMYQKIVSRLLSGGYYGILEVLEPEDEKDLTPPRMLLDGKTDGLIIIGQLRKEYRDFLYSDGFGPLMFLDSYDSINGKDSVISDGYYGMYAMTNYLISMGHRDICFVGTVGVTSSISDRYFGYCRAMNENGLAVTPDMVVPDRDESGRCFITLPERLPTAFACNCDYTAFDLIATLKENGVRVPEDVSIVGFDDYLFSNKSIPAITTYAVDMEGMTRTCVDQLLKKIHNKAHASNLRIISGRLVVKDSVAKINAVSAEDSRVNIERAGVL